MYCEPDILCILDKKSILKIKEFRKKNLNNDKITWNKISNGYIIGNNDIYIHLHGYCVGVVPRVNLKLVQSALSVLFTSQAIDGDHDHSKRI